MKPSKRKKFLAKEKVKGLFEQFSPQATAGHSGPPQQTYFCGSGLLMDYPLEKLFGCCVFFDWVLIRHPIYLLLMGHN